MLVDLIPDNNSLAHRAATIAIPHLLTQPILENDAFIWLDRAGINRELTNALAQRNNPLSSLTLGQLAQSCVLLDGYLDRNTNRGLPEYSKYRYGRHRLYNFDLPKKDHITLVCCR